MFFRNTILAILALVIGVSCGKSDGVSGKARVMFTAVYSGGMHTCGAMDDGRLTCWGYNGFGQLGLGHEDNIGDDETDFRRTDIYVELGAGRTATAVAGGAWHTCAILDNGSVKCWGYNYLGQLGQGDQVNRGDDAGEMGDSLATVNLGSGFTAKAIAAGSDHTCVILNDNSVKCWGDNISGQLGLGDTNYRGDGPGEMGNSLPVVNLGVGRTAKYIAAGGRETCAILDNDQLKCWGENSSGQLGQGNTLNIGTSAAGEIAASTAIDLGTSRYAVSVAIGQFHTCAVLDNATLKCWGSGGSGQLGLGNGNTLGDAGGEMGNALTAVSLGSGRTALSVKALAYGTCVLLDNYSVKCFGNGLYGQNGNGSIAYIGDGAGEMGDNLAAISLGTSRTALTIVAGDNHACVFLDNHFVKCWGYNAVSQLGLGDTVNRGDDSGEMGDNLPAVNEQNLNN